MSTVHSGQTAIPPRKRMLACLPGLIVFATLWVLTCGNLTFADWAEQSLSLWQSLGREILQSEPLAALLSLHIQPPGVNALQAADLAVSPSGHLVIGLVLFAMGFVGVALVTDSLISAGVPLTVSSIAGAFYALLPATVLYALWPFSTGPTMFAVALTIWGLARFRSAPATGPIVAGAGALLLFLTRSSFTWIAVGAFLIGLVVVTLRGRARSPGRAWAIGGLILVGATVAGIQVHYVTSFGVWTTSSWSGENLMKALSNSGRLNVSDGAIISASRFGLCHESVARALKDGTRLWWRPDTMIVLPGCDTIDVDAPRGSPSFDSAEKDGVYDGAYEGNFNWSQRLANSRVISDVSRTILVDDPMQLFRMAFVPSNGEGAPAAISIYMKSSEDYPFVAPLLAAYPNRDVGSLLSRFFAPGALGLIIMGLVAIPLRREHGLLLGQPLFYFGAALVGYHVIISNIGEYGENNRFQAEIAPALMVLSVLVLWALWPRGRHWGEPKATGHGTEQASEVAH